MNTKLYVDNLAAGTTERGLRSVFTPYGNVVEVHAPIDRTSGRSRGFAFVTMATPEGARAAILALNGKARGTGILTVTEAWPHAERTALPHRD